MIEKLKILSGIMLLIALLHISIFLNIIIVTIIGIILYFNDKYNDKVADITTNNLNDREKLAISKVKEELALLKFKLMYENLYDRQLKSERNVKFIKELEIIRNYGLLIKKLYNSQKIEFKNDMDSIERTLSLNKY